MTYFCKKGRGKYIIARLYSGKVVWSVDWPREPEPCKTDWKLNIKTLAGRCGYNAVMAHGTVTLTPVAAVGSVQQFDNGIRPGDWRMSFFAMIDAVVTGKLPILSGLAPSAVLPPVPEEPVARGLDDGFNPVALINKKLAGQPAKWLRVVRPVSYTEALRLGCNGTIKSYAVAAPTDNVLIECACGRLIVARLSVAEGADQQRWNDCGCRGIPTTSSKTMMRRAWREWCTITLVGSTDCALNKILTQRGLSTECKLGRFEDFFPWYTKHVRALKGQGQLVRRVDMTKPFTLDNLTLQEKRQTFADPWNDNCFKFCI